MRLVNLTKHDVILIDEQTGRSTSVPMSGGVARVSSRNRYDDTVEVDDVNIPILAVDERDVVGLPPPAEDTIYIVSGLVASVAGRDDVVAPARVLRTGQAVVGCRALLRYPKEGK